MAKPFSSERTISLETYKKNGRGVRSPVWIVEDGGLFYVRTDPTSWKAKRIRKNPRVRLAPSDMRGNVKGEWVDGEAHFIEGPEAARITELFKKKYGVSMKFSDFFSGARGSHHRAIVSIRVPQTTDVVG
jgi:hypothetical protein